MYTKRFTIFITLMYAPLGRLRKIQRVNSCRLFLVNTKNISDNLGSFSLNTDLHQFCDWQFLLVHSFFWFCSILFFNPLKYVVTGSRDGSIKVWDENFGIQIVFVGHHGPITSLSLYPQVCIPISEFFIFLCVGYFK